MPETKHPAVSHSSQYDDEQDDDGLKNVGELLRDERVDGETSVFQDSKKQSRRNNSEGMVFREEGDRNPDKADPFGEAEFKVVLVPEHKVAPDESRESAREGERGDDLAA